MRVCMCVRMCVHGCVCVHVRVRKNSTWYPLFMNVGLTRFFWDTGETTVLVCVPRLMREQWIPSAPLHLPSTWEQG